MGWEEEMETSEAERASIIAAYFADGRLKEIPSREKRKLVVLAEIAKDFESGRRYSEREVNDILWRRHPDTAALRRYLYHYGFLDREPNSSAYWVSSSSNLVGK
jgi:hypothetical protein